MNLSFIYSDRGGADSNGLAIFPLDGAISVFQMLNTPPILKHQNEIWLNQHEYALLFKFWINFRLRRPTSVHQGSTFKNIVIHVIHGTAMKNVSILV